MKPIFLSLFLLSMTISGLAQDRATALSEYFGLKDRAAALERVVMAPDAADVDAAARDGLNAARILPRDKYDTSYSNIRGGGAFYSFYYRYHDYGYGSDLMLEGDRLSTWISAKGIMADIGAVPASQVSKESDDALAVGRFQFAPDGRERSELHSKGIKAGGLIFMNHVKPIVGHTYILRSQYEDRYDVLVAFQIMRKDTDGSYILYWKLLDQYDTPLREPKVNTLSNSGSLKAAIPILSKHETDVRFDLVDGIVTLTGSIDKGNLPHLVERLHRAGARRVVNALQIK